MCCHLVFYCSQLLNDTVSSSPSEFYQHLSLVNSKSQLTPPAFQLEVLKVLIISASPLPKCLCIQTEIMQHQVQSTISSPGNGKGRNLLWEFFMIRQQYHISYFCYFFADGLTISYRLYPNIQSFLSAFLQVTMMSLGILLQKIFFLNPNDTLYDELSTGTH